MENRRWTIDRFSQAIAYRPPSFVLRHAQQLQHPCAHRQWRGGDSGTAQAHIGLERFGVAKDIECAQRAVAEEVQVNAALDRRAPNIAVKRRHNMDAMTTPHQASGDLLNKWRSRFPWILGVRRCEHADVHSILDM